MSWQRQLLSLVNRALAPFNLRLDSRSKETEFLEWLADLQRREHFRRPVYPVPTTFRASKHREILAQIAEHRESLANFESRNEFGFHFENVYFTSPDVEVLYAMIRHVRPAQIVEIGCGNSTRVMRQAIRDAGLNTKITCIDPKPRVDVSALADQLVYERVEELTDFSVFDSLAANDFLFIDSSHMARPGSDVLYEFFYLVPRLSKGVLVHIHDIFLPYEYPYVWIQSRWGWNEQYLVAIILLYCDAFDVHWPGRYVQAICDDFDSYFPNPLNGRKAQSLWLQVNRPIGGYDDSLAKTVPNRVDW